MFETSLKDALLAAEDQYFQGDAEHIPCLPDLFNDPLDPVIVSHVDHPHKVVVSIDDPNELASLLGEVSTILSTPVSQRWIERSVNHERQHQDAAGALGCEEGVFGVKISMQNRGDRVVPRFNAYFTPTWFETTAIGFAAIAARPVNPSPSDIEKVRRAGFENTDVLGDAIVEHNDRYGERIPLPLSYKPSLFRRGSMRRLFC